MVRVILSASDKVCNGFFPIYDSRTKEIEGLSITVSSSHNAEKSRRHPLIKVGIGLRKTQGPSLDSLEQDIKNKTALKCREELAAMVCHRLQCLRVKQ